MTGRLASPAWEQETAAFKASRAAWFDLMFLVSGARAGLERRKLWPDVVRQMQQAAKNPEALALFDLICSKVFPEQRLH